MEKHSRVIQAVRDLTRHRVEDVEGMPGLRGLGFKRVRVYLQGSGGLRQYTYNVSLISYKP